ncbi:hypothetical protein DFS33DRAFT_1372838 [Desarmillaria ectypa]|nr:hypothetical protein DFS33DRAFT_1372838 [Desarmillaria ectypa]
MSDPRPSSPYVFGEATSRSGDGNAQLRKLLRSPSQEQDRAQGPSEGGNSAKGSSARHQTSGGMTEGAGQVKERDETQMDTEGRGRGLPREAVPFDYSMRRHSIAVGQESPGRLQGRKRKISSERAGFSGQDIDPQLIGPGVGNKMDVDEGPAFKRRGSAVDTARIAQLSLNERRNSTDGRGGQWPWVDGRRDSSSLGGGYTSPASAVSGTDGRHQPPASGIASFAWPHSDQSPMQHHPLDHDPHRQFDPMSNIPIMPPINFPPDRALDRRMSVPDNLNPSSNPAGPTRVLRSRSRPPSRQMRSQEASEEPTSAPSPPGSSKVSKDAGATPYSRSPELRVSHKLAERKRRKEMKDLFDELRDQLPADRGMKASKWEILSKAIDFVAQLKQSHQDMAREIDMLRHELDVARQGGGLPPFPPGGGPPGHPVYGQPPPGVPPYPLPPPAALQQHPPPPPLSRPASSQGVFPPGNGPALPPQNGNVNRPDGPT